MDSAQHNSSRRSRRNRTSVWREKVASFKEEIESVRQREKTFEEAKEQLQELNCRLLERLKLETDKRLPFEQTFQIFKAGLEVEKQRELMLMALKRHVSSPSHHLKFATSLQLNLSTALQSEKESSAERVSTETMVTSSIASLKEDARTKDSGLEIHEVHGLKGEMYELKSENSRLQSKIECMRKDAEEHVVVIGGKNEMADGLKEKCKMLENHASSLTFQVHHLNERSAHFKRELELTEDQLEEMAMKNAEHNRSLNEAHNRKMINREMKIEELEKALAILKSNSSQLKSDLQEMHIEKQAGDMVNEVIAKCVDVKINEDLSRYEKEISNFKEELRALKTDIECYQSKMENNAEILEEANKKCATYEEEVSSLKSQLREASGVRELLEEKLIAADVGLKVMEITNEDEILKITAVHKTKMIEQGLKIDCLEEELATRRNAEVEMSMKLHDMEVELCAIKLTNEAITAALTATCEAEGVKHQRQMEEFEVKVAERVSCTNLKLLNSNREVDYLKKMLLSKEVELMHESKVAFTKILEEQREKARVSKEFEMKLNSSINECRELKELSAAQEEHIKNVNKELESSEEKIKRLENQVMVLEDEVVSKDDKIHELDRKIVILYDWISSKDLVIEQLLAKKKKKRSCLGRLCCF